MSDLFVVGRIRRMVRWIGVCTLTAGCAWISAQTPAKSKPAKEPITIGVGDLRGRFSEEARRLRERLVARVKDYNKDLPEESEQEAEDVRIWLQLNSDLEDGARKAAWKDHEDLVIPTVRKPGKAAMEAFRKVLAEEEKKRAEEQERVRQAQAKAEELRLKAEQNEIQAAQAQAQAQQAAALERQAAALEKQAEEQQRMRLLMDY